MSRILLLSTLFTSALPTSWAQPTLSKPTRRKESVSWATPEIDSYNDTAVALDPERWLAYRGYLHCMFTRGYQKAITDLLAAEQLTPNAFTMDRTFSFSSH